MYYNMLTTKLMLCKITFREKQHIQLCKLCMFKVAVCCIELAEGVTEKRRGRKGSAQASVPKLHLILEECLPSAHSNLT